MPFSNLINFPTACPKCKGTGLIEKLQRSSDPRFPFWGLVRCKCVLPVVVKASKKRAA